MSPSGEASDPAPGTGASPAAGDAEGPSRAAARARTADGDRDPGDGGPAGPRGGGPAPARDGRRSVDGGPRSPTVGGRSVLGPLRTAVRRVRWFVTTDHGWAVFAREVLSSALVVLLVGLVLFAASGVWPPMVAVESGSMEPHMHRGDLVFIVEEHRFSPPFAHVDTGVVPVETAADAGFRKFGDFGDVIVYDPPDKGGPPIIHRAVFWVDAGENWYDRADPAHVDGDSCAAIRNCPAPHAGFITRGDANPTYDQVSGISSPVRPAWITGTAEARVPWLGYIRLRVSELSVVVADRYAIVADVTGAMPATVR